MSTVDNNFNGALFHKAGIFSGVITLPKIGKVKLAFSPETGEIGGKTLDGKPVFLMPLNGVSFPDVEKRPTNYVAKYISDETIETIELTAWFAIHEKYGPYIQLRPTTVAPVFEVDGAFDALR